MSTTHVSKPTFNDSHVTRFGPATMEHRTKDAGLSELGTYFMTFVEEGLSDQWTLQYEETIYVIAGSTEIHVLQDDTWKTVSGAPEELIVLPKGSTVRYGGTLGTKLLLSISPVNWRDVSN